MTKEKFRQLCKRACKKQHWFVIIDISNKKKKTNIEVNMMSFTYQIKLILSLKKMENLLKQIINNTEPKRSFSVVVSDNKTRFKPWFKPRFKPPIQKKRDYEISLINLKILISKYR